MYWKDNFYEQIDNERKRQDEKWGEQNHEPAYWLAILAEEVGELATAILALEQGPPEPAKEIEPELIQVAAVAKVIWECGKRRGWL